MKIFKSEQDYREWFASATLEEVAQDTSEALSEIDMDEEKEVLGYRCQKGILCGACAVLNVYEHNLEGKHEDIKEGSGLTCDACHLPLDRP